LDATNWEARRDFARETKYNRLLESYLYAKKWKDSHSSKAALRIRFVESGSVMLIRIRDPGSGAFLPMDPGWEKFQILDPGSWINIPELVFENLASVFLG
jgi:hypothetical protein